MTADEILNEFGYTIVREKDIIFIKDEIDNIIVVIRRKSISFYKITYTKSELQAINEICKELG